jgi:uncharacterized protein YndB with AHSA1/START domain
MENEETGDITGDIYVERSVDLDTDPETVWEHLTDGDLVGVWLGSDVTIEPRRGGAILVTGDGTGDIFGVVEEFIPGRRIQWSWRKSDGLPALVEIEIEPNDDGTRLTVRETLLPWQVTEMPAQRHVRGTPLQPFSSRPHTQVLDSNAA